MLRFRRIVSFLPALRWNIYKNRPRAFDHPSHVTERTLAHRGGCIAMYPSSPEDTPIEKTGWRDQSFNEKSKECRKNQGLKKRGRKAKYSESWKTPTRVRISGRNREGGVETGFDMAIILTGAEEESGWGRRLTRGPMRFGNAFVVADEE